MKEKRIDEGNRILLDQIVEDYKADLILHTQEIVRMNTVRCEPGEGAPFGEGIHQGLQKILEIAENMGFRTRNLEGYLGYAEYGEGEEYMAILAHLDVVPEGEGWSYPPYGAEIHGGRMYGRGTIDDKGPLMAALYGLKAVKDSGLLLKHKVRVIFGTDEESEGKDMTYYKAREPMPLLGFTPDANFPVIYAEKGIVNFSVRACYEEDRNCQLLALKGGDAINAVPGRAEALLKPKDAKALLEKVLNFDLLENERLEGERQGDFVKLRAYGVAAHGSTPELGVNAVMILVRFLREADITEGKLKEALEFIEYKIGGDTAGTNMGIAYADESGKLTMNLGKALIEKGQICLEIDIRYPVTYAQNQVCAGLSDHCAQFSMEATVICHEKPLYFPKEHVLVQTLAKVYKEYTGVEESPIAIGGGTYAKYLDNIVAFGAVYPNQVEVEHQSDEYIDVEQLIHITKIYAGAILKLANA